MQYGGLVVSWALPQYAYKMKDLGDKNTKNTTTPLQIQRGEQLKMIGIILCITTIYQTKGLVLHRRIRRTLRRIEEIRRLTGKRPCCNDASN